MRLRSLGNTGTKIGTIGLGCMGMSWLYQESSRDDRRSVRVINEALDLGGNLLDTADVYGAGHNETLLGKAVAGRREEAVIATKAGLVLEDLRLRAAHRDGSPAYLRKAVQASLRRLNLEVIDLYYVHRVDPTVPLAETWGTMAELVDQGLVRWLGLSEATVAQAREVHAIHPVTAVQSELSLWTRDALAGASGGMVGWCESVGASFIPFAPLGRGFLTGTLRAGQFESGDFRTANPRFDRAAMEANQRIVDGIREVADRRSVTPAQVAIAWTLAQGEQVVPIPGTKNPRYLRENLAAAEVHLSEEDFADLGALPAPVGSRY
ncbi:aldo/keto reductase [Streptomyces sp. NPDC016845]|uniref:aldo/keto reductase n=1 Tax=Streptomyces sp. NPDC016845 TaxID=3364972 RepID=UPI00379B8DE8